MRRSIKNPSSKIIVENLNYVSGNRTNNRKLAEILFREQKGFCAYTDEYLGRTTSPDIEHFNPTLKSTPQDNYRNWFLVKHQWNIEKSYKWKNFQPILHPTANDFEQRIIYTNGDYVAKSDLDIEATNLISLLKLDDLGLADERKKYINRKHEDMKAYGQDAITFFSALMKDDICHISYPRAIKEEFKIDLWQTLN